MAYGYYSSAYAEYDFYVSLYGDSLNETDFRRLSFDASRLMDRHTSGIDGYKKLKYAFPTDADDAEAVMRCMCELVKLSADIEEEEKRIRLASETVVREDGTVTGRVVSSVSSGAESVSYSTGTGGETAVSAAVSDPESRRRLFTETVRKYLGGVKDAAGINLLYMGEYPYVP